MKTIFSTFILLVCVLPNLSCQSNRPSSRSEASDTAAPSIETQAVAEEADPAEVALGERLFKDGRFSRFYFDQTRGNVNAVLQKGDPAVETIETIGGRIPHPHRGSAISCASCHMVDQAKEMQGGGNRGYNDFSKRSRMTKRPDGAIETARNSPTMVGSAVGTAGAKIMHIDGEFSSTFDVAFNALLGRNMGWLPDETETAEAHIVAVIRADNGTFEIDGEAQEPYAKVFLGEDPSLAKEMVLPKEYRLDVRKASESEILHAAARLMEAYMVSLDFSRDEKGLYNGSPYDRFLIKNGLPRAPGKGETALIYSERMREQVKALKKPRFISEADGKFKLHKQQFVFGPEELKGFEVFTGRGRCIQCHSAPDFTDRGLHNVGTAQEEYDNAHGAGSFAKLVIPDLRTRALNPQRYLPASAKYPRAVGPFRHRALKGKPNFADLGAWNTLSNEAMPVSQTVLRKALCESQKLQCDDQAIIEWGAKRGLQGEKARAAFEADLLDKSVSTFKTPTLRNLGQSEPYMHNGEFAAIEDVIRFYARTTALASHGLVRNGDPHLKEMIVTAEDIAALTAFLKSLNEDYE